MPPPQWFGMEALSKWLSRTIVIRPFCDVAFWCIPSKAHLLFFFNFIVLLTFFWNYSQEKTFPSFSKDWVPSFRIYLTLCLSLNKAVNTLCLLQYNPFLWYCPTSIIHISTNSTNKLRSMIHSFFFSRWDTIMDKIFEKHSSFHVK